MAEARIRGVRLTREERLAVRRISGGCSFEEAAAAVRCSTKTVQRLLNTVGGMPPRKPTRSKRHLSLAEREEVSRGLGSGASYRAIARRLGRAPSTISREVHGNGGPRRYRACRADGEPDDRKPRSSPMSSAPHSGGIDVELPVDYPDAHETICSQRPGGVAHSSRMRGTTAAGTATMARSTGPVTEPMSGYAFKPCMRSCLGLTG